MDNEIINVISNKCFVNNALYHSACITKYMYLLREKERKYENIDSTFDQNEVFQKLLESITDVLFVHKRVYSMSYLLERFFIFPPEIASKNTTYRLQLKLQKHFGESLVVETLQGQGASHLV